jgi:IPT/TIG domain
MKKIQSVYPWLAIFFFLFSCLSAMAQLPSKDASPQIRAIEAAIQKDKAAGKMQQKGLQLSYNNNAGEDTAAIRKNYQGLILKSGKPYTLVFSVSRIPFVNTNVITGKKINTAKVENPTAVNTNPITNEPLPERNLVAAHSISGVTPEKAPGGAEVIISGQKFGTVMTDVRAWVNGKEAIVRGITNDQIQIVVPVKAGSGPIKVQVKDQTAAGTWFTYQWKATVSLFAGRRNNHADVDGAESNARFDHPRFLCIDQFDNIYVRGASGAIRMINKFAEVSTLIGDPPAAIRGLLQKPMTVVTDARGNKYELASATGTTSIGTTGSRYINKITPSGVVSILAGSAGGLGYGGADGYGDAAVFAYLQAIAIDAAGNLYVTEIDDIELMNHGDRVRMISPQGRVTTLAGGGPAGRIGLRGATDGVGTDALFTGPGGIAVDSKGNLFVAETSNGIIRKITLE